MKRRDFFQNASLGLIGTGLVANNLFVPNQPTQPVELDKWKGKGPANIIFLVSDGMSIGTLTMASILRQRMDGMQSHWLQLYEQNLVRRALMDMSSANSWVTDSAAASSSWGGGVRINNGALNTNPDGTSNKPILQKFKEAGKSVGCVTTVPITHATPAGFSVANARRGDQAEIAMQYLPLKFDVMMGGGVKYFDASTREDKTDAFAAFTSAGYEVAKSRQQMMNIDTKTSKPVLGVFYNDGLPYAVDRKSDSALNASVPSLAEMTKKAIDLMSKNKKGFVLQVEAGKVDWAAHANDAGALLYDQLEFDDAIKTAIDFAKADKNTLVIITTDHGNSNPGLLYSGNTKGNFDSLMRYKHTNEWILSQVKKGDSTSKIIEVHEAATTIALKQEDAVALKEALDATPEKGMPPFQLLGKLQGRYIDVHWMGTNHTSDFVELAMFGPGSELLKPFVKNTELHNYMLNVCGLANMTVKK